MDDSPVNDHRGTAGVLHSRCRPRLLFGFNGAMAEHSFIFEKGPDPSPSMIRLHQDAFDGVHFRWIEHVLSHPFRAYLGHSV